MRTILESRRLLLREMTIADLDFIAQMLAGEDVTDRIAALEEPFKGIAEQAQAEL